MPLRTGSAQDFREAAPYHGLPLYGLSADDRQRLLLERRDPERRVLSHARRARHRGPTRREPPLLLPALHELDAHAARGDGLVRQSSPDDARRSRPVRPVHRDVDERELPWASTPAVHSFETMPDFDAFEGLTREYAEQVRGSGSASVGRAASREPELGSSGNLPPTGTHRSGARATMLSRASLRSGAPGRRGPCPRESRSRCPGSPR